MRVNIGKQQIAVYTQKNLFEIRKFFKKPFDFLINMCIINTVIEKVLFWRSIMNIKPLFDKVVVEAVTVEEKTKSGFFLPSSAQEKPQVCVVVAVGPGGVLDGKEVVMQVKEGDKVLCAKYAGTDFKVDGKEFTILKQSDILAIVE